MSGVTLADGTVLTAEMSPLERFNAVAKSMNAPTVARPAAPTFGPQGMTPETARQMARGEAERAARSGNATAPEGTIAGKAPPPSPQTLERSNAMPPQGNPSANRQAEFDAEMQAKGLQLRPDGSKHADGEGHGPEVFEKLTARYRQLHKDLIEDQEPGKRKTQKEAELRASFERDLKRAGDGRPLSEFELKIDMPKSKPAKVSQFTPAQWAEGHKSVVNEHGMMPLARINKDALSGYTLPRVIEDQHYSPEIFSILADAREQGLTQKQVDGMIRAEMKRAGWIK